MITLPITPGTLPEGWCWVNGQQTLIDYAAHMSVSFSNAYTFFNYGNTEPSAENRGSPWIRLNADGSPDRMYVYYGGTWVSPHPVLPGSRRLEIWEGSLAELESEDGGAPGTVTDTTGPFWEEVTAMRGLFPVGVGTLPSGTVIGVGGTGGNETQTLTEAQMPPHKHLVVSSTFATSATNISGTNQVSRRRNFSANDDYTLLGVSDEADSGLSSETGGSGSPATTDDFSVIPPYKGIYFIRRTARRFWTP